MHLEIPDEDAAILFSLLPHLCRQSLPISNVENVLDRVHSQIAAEGRRRNLRWVFVDEDVEMGVEVASAMPEPTQSQSPPRLLSPLPDLALGFPSLHSSPSLGPTLPSPVQNSPSLAPTSPTLAPSSPTLTPLSSPASTVVELPFFAKKRSLGLAGLDGQSVRLSKRICQTTTDCTDGDTSLSLKDRTQVAGAAAGDAGGNPGEPRRANACESRGGSSARAHRAALAQTPRTISEIQSHLEKELSGLDPEEEEEGSDENTPGRRKKGKAKEDIVEKWSIKGDPLPLWLSYVTTSPELQDKLKQLLIALSTSSDDAACYR
ncbi:hypothetical protein B0H13DRAFT_2543584 [Mycena leptocephala]|nr:hypothetical protein B0H13DRAFT_2543584 [Mycena leptocephala]